MLATSPPLRLPAGIGGEIDALLDEPDRAVSEQGVGAAGMLARKALPGGGEAASIGNVGLIPVIQAGGVLGREAVGVPVQGDIVPAVTPLKCQKLLSAAR